MTLFSNLFMDNPEILLIVGIIVLTASLMLHLRKRHRQSAKNKAERQAVAQAAREAERKRQIQKGERAKTRPSVLAPDRVPPAQPYDHTFTGAVSPSSIAKWEAEIHQIGRQILGQIDSKMVVLQTLTLEANRTANRMELLLEHIEHIITKKEEVSSKERVESLPSLESPTPVVEESPADYTHTNLIPAESSTRLEAYTDILNELDAELEQIRLLQSAPSESVLPATIIKAPPSSNPERLSRSEANAPNEVLRAVQESHPPTSPRPAIQHIPSTVSLGSGNPLLSDPLSLSSPRLPGDLSLWAGKERPPSITPQPKAIGQTSSNRVSMDTVFERGGG